MRDLAGVLEAIRLPEGIRWDPTHCTLGHGASGGYTTAFVSWIVSMPKIPCCEAFSEGVCCVHGTPRLFAWRVTFPLMAAASLGDVPKLRSDVEGYVLREADAFLAALAAGTAPEVADGGLLP